MLCQLIPNIVRSLAPFWTQADETGGVIDKTVCLLIASICEYFLPKIASHVVYNGK